MLYLTASIPVREVAPTSSTGEVPAEAGDQRVPSPPFTPGRFAGRTAIVTGAGCGIGRATAWERVLGVNLTAAPDAPDPGGGLDAVARLRPADRIGRTR